MSIDVTVSNSAFEESCITPITVTVTDPNRSRQCRYYVAFTFQPPTTDSRGDLAGKKFGVVPGVPHHFWIAPKGAGLVGVWGVKECPESSDTVGLLEDLPDNVVNDENFEQFSTLVRETADPGYEIVDMRVHFLPVKTCDNFDAKKAAIQTAAGSGIAAGGIAATILTAFGTPAAGAAAAGGAGGAAAAGGFFGAAGSITAAGIGLALGIALVVALIVGLIVWLVTRKDCCVLGVSASSVGSQGAPAGPISPP